MFHLPWKHVYQQLPSNGQLVLLDSSGFQHHAIVSLLVTVKRLSDILLQFCSTGIFPEPEHDPVIQIANMVVRQGQHEPFIRNVFTLNTCAPIVGCQVLSFPDEQELLKVSSNIYTYPTWAVKLLSISCILYCPFQFQHNLWVY